MNDSTTSKATVTIKKYANRRLYNTATSSYVTLEDLSAMVKEGVEFNVYDAKTSEDITRSVLTQIIVEEEGKSGQNLLPIGFLRQLIGFYGDNMQWMVPKYLDHSMDLLSKNQDQLRGYFQSAFGGIFPFSSTFEEMGKQNIAMFERAMRMFAPQLGDLAAMVQQGACDQADAACCSDNAQTTCTDSKKDGCCSTATSTGTNTDTATTKSSVKNETTALTKTTDTTPVVTPVTAAPIAVVPSTTTNPVTSTSSNPANVTPIADHAADPLPMTNVKTAAASASTGADDMQQKIANLQRQLAELAKTRA